MHELCRCSSSSQLHLAPWSVLCEALKVSHICKVIDFFTQRMEVSRGNTPFADEEADKERSMASHRATQGVS